MLNGQIREKSGLAPCLLNSLTVMLEISQKSKMSANMFARLKMAYAIKFKDLLEEKLEEKTVLKNNGEILTVYQNHIIQIIIKPPSDSETSGSFGLQEQLAMIALHNSSYPGLCQIVHQWMVRQCLAKSIPDKVIDCILASLFSTKNPPMTIENGLLQFLKLVSFTDFSKEYLILRSEDSTEGGDKWSKFTAGFHEKRGKYPALCLVSGSVVPEVVEADVSPIYLTRLVNCARRSLHQLTNRPLDFDSVVSQDFPWTENQFEIIVNLKPHQLPVPASNSGKFNGKLETFPIVDYDPLNSFLNEVMALSTNVHFFFNETLCQLGLKLNQMSTEEEKTFVEDLQIIGKDLVKEVKIVKQK